MADLASALKDTPLPTIFVVAGVIFWLLAIAGSIAGKITVLPGQQRTAGVVGTLFVVLGMMLYLIPGRSNNRASNQTAPESISSEKTIPTTTPTVSITPAAPSPSTSRIIVPEPVSTPAERKSAIAEVVIHVRSEDQMELANRVGVYLKGQGYDVLKIRQVSDVWIPQTQVRYFHWNDDMQDESRAKQLGQVIEKSSFLTGSVAIKPIAGYVNTMPRNRYEVWLASNAR